VRGGIEWDVERLLASLVELRDRVRESHATARELADDKPAARLEKLNHIAVKLGVHILPSSFKEWIHVIANCIGIPLELLGHQSGIPFVGVAWEIVQIPLTRGAALGLEHLRFVQRRIEFPGQESHRPSLDEVRRSLRRT